MAERNRKESLKLLQLDPRGIEHCVKEKDVGKRDKSENLAIQATEFVCDDNTDIVTLSEPGQRAYESFRDASYGALCSLTAQLIFDEETNVPKSYTSKDDNLMPPAFTTTHPTLVHACKQFSHCLDVVAAILYSIDNDIQEIFNGNFSVNENSVSHEAKLLKSIMHMRRKFLMLQLDMKNNESNERAQKAILRMDKANCCFTDKASRATSLIDYCNSLYQKTIHSRLTDIHQRLVSLGKSLTAYTISESYPVEQLQTFKEASMILQMLALEYERDVNDPAFVLDAHCRWKNVLARITDNIGHQISTNATSKADSIEMSKFDSTDGIRLESNSIMWDPRGTNILLNECHRIARVLRSSGSSSSCSTKDDLKDILLMSSYKGIRVSHWCHLNKSTNGVSDDRSLRSLSPDPIEWPSLLRAIESSYKGMTSNIRTYESVAQDDNTKSAENLRIPWSVDKIFIPAYARLCALMHSGTQAGTSTMLTNNFSMSHEHFMGKFRLAIDHTEPSMQRDWLYLSAPGHAALCLIRELRAYSILSSAASQRINLRHLLCTARLFINYISQQTIKINNGVRYDILLRNIQYLQFRYLWMKDCAILILMCIPMSNSLQQGVIIHNDGLQLADALDEILEKAPQSIQQLQILPPLQSRDDVLRLPMSMTHPYKDILDMMRVLTQVRFVPHLLMIEMLQSITF